MFIFAAHEADMKIFRIIPHNIKQKKMLPIKQIRMRWDELSNVFENAVKLAAIIIKGNYINDLDNLMINYIHC